MLKTALVHEWLIELTGSEKVLEAIYELFPSPIYTLIKDDKALKGTVFEKAQIYTSFLQRLPAVKRFYRNYLPLFPIAIEQFDLSNYDVIISSSHSVAKGVLVNPEQIHICYCHTPMRYIWLFPKEYLQRLNLIKRLIASILFHYLRIWDLSTSNRVDYFLANSEYVAERIKKIYRRQAQVIYPPVDIEKFEPCSEKEDFYLTVSRLVPYKRIDIIVEAFSKLKNKKLVIIGRGPELNRLKSKATDNIKFLDKQPFDILREYLRKAKAFIFAGEEDFGISMVEAQACGTPVIAFGKGGAKEIVIKNKTGLFFYKQHPCAVIEAVESFEKMRFDPLLLRKNAERFSKKRFKQRFKEFVLSIT